MEDALGSSPSTTSKQVNKQKIRRGTKKSAVRCLGWKAAAIYTNLDNMWSSSRSHYLGNIVLVISFSAKQP